MTKSRMTMRAILAIFHSLLILCSLLTESLDPSQLIFDIALPCKQAVSIRSRRLHLWSCDLQMLVERGSLITLRFISASERRRFSRRTEGYRPCGVTDGPEDAAVAEDDDGKRDEEDKGEEQHRVGTDRRGEGHVVPGAGGHQAFWHIRTWGRKQGSAGSSQHRSGPETLPAPPCCCRFTRVQMVAGSIPDESKHELW